MSYACNPVNINYRYQFNRDQREGGRIQICREAADPSMIYFKGRYYIFASMTLGVWVSDDLTHWENHRLPDTLPLYDYAPDVRVLDEYVYFCASRRHENCDRYRTKDILNGPYEKVPGTFPFWDPNLFADDDGRIYFYWGCSSELPIYGCELDPETMNPKTEPLELLRGHPDRYGFERKGADNSIDPIPEAVVDEKVHAFLQARGIPDENLTPEVAPMLRGMFSQKPFIEGAWMDKHNGRYYLQYAFAGTEFNTYGDGVYVGDSPLGPFTLAESNPYSYHPGGFLPGAGHGSTMQDEYGNWWHTATMRISLNHDMERRVGIWPAGFDADGELFCNQRFGDWPYSVKPGKRDPWQDPEWYLLSYGKSVSASSAQAEHSADHVTDENVRTLWRPQTADKSEWVQVDLGKVCTVNAVQVNFGDCNIDIPVPGEIHAIDQARYIDDAPLRTRWKLEVSEDGVNYTVMADKTDADTDLPHDLVIAENGVQARYLRLTAMEVPYGQIPAVSGLRVFGTANGAKPAAPQFTAVRTAERDMEVQITADDAVGHLILWGAAPDKLYHSWLVYGTDAVSAAKRIGALVAGRHYAVRVDAFNESGITVGGQIITV